MIIERDGRTSSNLIFQLNGISRIPSVAPALRVVAKLLPSGSMTYSLGQDVPRRVAGLRTDDIVQDFSAGLGISCFLDDFHP